MTQKATVIEIKGKNAIVSVRRSSMCDGCEKNGGCSGSCAAGELLGANKTMTAAVSNEVGAKVGDTVEIESESRTVLGYAALIFLFPILLGSAAYTAADFFGAGESGAMLSALGGFAAAFLFIIIFDRLKKKNGRQDIRITRIL
ncbi:MAG: hypothetical protein E7638_05085 [Ruminococcaceae bacterium]|nr:hypothetical protein [Oscillospiraceae bacterium]